MVTKYPVKQTGAETRLIDPRMVRSSISWSSVLAGAAAAIAVQIGLSQLCLSVGLSFYVPAEPGSSIVSIASGGVWALLATAIVSLLVGGWVAGRAARHSSTVDAGVGGGLVWAVYGVAGLVFMATAAGVLARGTISMAGAGMTAVATGAAAVAPAATALVAPSWDELKAQVEAEAGKVDVTQPSDDRLAQRSRLMELLGSSFSSDSSAAQKASEKDELITLVASQTGVSAPAAERAYDQWQSAWQKATKRFDDKKAEAESKAKAMAAEAAERTSRASLYLFLATLIGLAAAVGGAVLGRASAGRPEELVVLTQSTTPVVASVGVGRIRTDDERLG